MSPTSSEARTVQAFWKQIRQGHPAKQKYSGVTAKRYLRTPSDLKANRDALEHDYFQRPAYRKVMREAAKEYDKWLKEEKARTAKGKGGRPKKLKPINCTREAA